jgi:hypothetical protein
MTSLEHLALSIKAIRFLNSAHCRTLTQVLCQSSLLSETKKSLKGWLSERGQEVEEYLAEQ